VRFDSAIFSPSETFGRLVGCGLRLPVPGESRSSSFSGGGGQRSVRLVVFLRLGESTVTSLRVEQVIVDGRFLRFLFPSRSDDSGISVISVFPFLFESLHGRERIEGRSPVLFLIPGLLP